MNKILVLAALAAAGLSAGTAHAAGKCTKDSVKVGSFRIDTYEASAWRIPDPTGINKGLVKKVQKGKATVDDLTAGGATLLGANTASYLPCSIHGHNCVNDIYAVSIAGVIPSNYITWFQAQQACSNSGKRLPSNAEWQQAVSGTPDGAPCHVNTGFLSVTGAANCVSSYGAHDMVGNLWEWTADWTAPTTICGAWDSTDDFQCLAGAATTGSPTAIFRGGYHANGTSAGPLAVAGWETDPAGTGLGFRCAR